MTGRGSPTQVNQPLPVLLVKPPEAARILAISERLLWSMTISGDIPSVKIGRARRYDLRDLDRWVQQRKQGRR